MQNEKSVRCDRKRMVLQEAENILIRTNDSGSDLQESGSYPESSCFGKNFRNLMGSERSAEMESRLWIRTSEGWSEVTTSVEKNGR